MWWRATMAASASVLLLLLCALENCQAAPTNQNSEAEFTAGGTLMGVKPHRLLRRDASVGDEVEVEEPTSSSSSLEERQRLHGVSDGKTRQAKIQKGTAGNPYAVYEGEYANAGGSWKNWHEAPAWEAHPSMPAMPTCTMDVTTEMGLSDYGTVSHSCSACEKNCTEENKQQPTYMEWLFEPPLESCNAREVKFFVNWTDITGLASTGCVDKGLRHKFQLSFATNAGQDVSGYENRELAFEAWMGPEVVGGPSVSGSSFEGKHVFEVEDTEEPSRSSNCNDANPGGRWFAIPGEMRAGESFKCERICKSSHTCNCNRNTGMRCTADITMASAQVFSYHVTQVERQANGTLDGDHYYGPEWQVVAEDLTQQSPVRVVGRVILAGNSADYGIKKMRQTHEHLGCVPCDLFYESTIVTGPFVLDPPGVHAIKSSTGFPPTLTDQSCERFRISAVSGFAVKFETGPGLWPPFEVNDTIFTCDQQGQNTCHR